MPEKISMKGTKGLETRRQGGKVWSRLIAKITRSAKLGSAPQMLLGGASTILGLFPGTASVGAMGSFGLLVWQGEQQQKFVGDVRQRIETLDQKKLDQDFLKSEEFVEIIIRVTDCVSQSASEVKRHSLANALVAAVTMPTSSFKGKQTIVRLISQMSDEEIIALRVLSHLEDNSLPGSSKQGISTKIIAEQLDWSIEDTVTACEGLLQLGLVLDMAGVLFDTTGVFREFWGTTTLAQRVIKFATRQVESKGRY